MLPLTPTSHYLAAYPASLVTQALDVIRQGKLAEIFLAKYPEPHAIRTDKGLYDFVVKIKDEYLRNSGQLSRVAYDSKLHIVRHALGTHTAISRVQGGKLKAKRELHVSGLFRSMPEAFLRMIVVHELAHFKERDHDKAFYQLCCYMEPHYHQLEFDLRVYLTYLDAGGEPLWEPRGAP